MIIDVGLGHPPTRSSSGGCGIKGLLKRKGRGRGLGPGSRCRALKVLRTKKELFKGRSTKQNTLDHGLPRRSIPSFVPLLAPTTCLLPLASPRCGFLFPLELGLVIVVVPTRNTVFISFRSGPPLLFSSSPLLLFALHPVRPPSSFTSPRYEGAVPAPSIIYLETNPNSHLLHVVRRRKMSSKNKHPDGWGG